jgi:hypothetical protein
MLSVALILVVGALIAAIASAMGKAPLWVAVILLCVVAAIQVLPLN